MTEPALQDGPAPRLTLVIPITAWSPALRATIGQLGTLLRDDPALSCVCVVSRGADDAVDLVREAVVQSPRLFGLFSTSRLGLRALVDLGLERVVDGAVAVFTPGGPLTLTDCLERAWARTRPTGATHCC